MAFLVATGGSWKELFLPENRGLQESQKLLKVPRIFLFIINHSSSFKIKDTKSYYVLSNDRSFFDNRFFN